MTHVTAQVSWQLGLTLAAGNQCMSQPEEVKQLSPDVSWGKAPKQPAMVSGNRPSASFSGVRGVVLPS